MRVGGVNLIALAASVGVPRGKLATVITGLLVPGLRGYWKLHGGFYRDCAIRRASYKLQLHGGITISAAIRTSFAFLAEELGWKCISLNANS